MTPKEWKKFVNFCIYSQFADHFGDQLLAAAKIHDYLGLDPVGNVEIKTGGATGGSSVLVGIMAIASGYASLVPVVGWERMDEGGAAGTTGSGTLSSSRASVSATRRSGHPGSHRGSRPGSHRVPSAGGRRDAHKRDHRGHQARRGPAWRPAWPSATPAARTLGLRWPRQPAASWA